MQHELTALQERKVEWIGDITRMAADLGYDIMIFIPGFFKTRCHDLYQEEYSSLDGHGEAYLASLANDEIGAPINKEYDRDTVIYAGQLGEAFQYVIYDLGITMDDILAKRSFAEWYDRLNDPHLDSSQYASIIEEDFGYQYYPKFE